MVKLSEVTDEHFEEVQSGPIPSDNDDDFEDYSDSDSEGEHHGHSHNGPHGHSHGRHNHRYKEHFDSHSDTSDDEDEDDDEDDDDITLEESIYERLVALKDIIPIKQRTKISNAVNGVWDWITWSGKTGGKVAFVLSTGVMMVGVPYALAVAEEGQMVEMEREMKLQQSANELIAGSSVGGPAAAGGQQGQGLQF